MSYVGMTRDGYFADHHRTYESLPYINEITGQGVDEETVSMLFGSSYDERIRVAHEILGLSDCGFKLCR